MFTRRSFLGIIGAIPVLGTALVKEPAKERVLINRFNIAGFQYYDGPKKIKKIEENDKLLLKAEPENPYDKFAVEVFHGKTKLGYIPRYNNEHLSRLLLQGAKLSAKVKKVSPQEAPWNAVRVYVYMA